MPKQGLNFLTALASGGLLTLMVLFNGQFAVNGSALFASWMAHGTGMIAALVFVGLLALSGRRGVATTPGPIPLWAYLGGLSGALTVMLTSTTVNGVLALSGTLALGLVGQTVFSLAADRFGFFGLERRRIGTRQVAALVLILAGSALIIFSGRS
ncbi:MAG: DMT family transporter, partial [Albidovulum sp.]